MIIKVCGMREAENIRAAECLPIDWLGFIFYDKSPRWAEKEYSSFSTTLRSCQSEQPKRVGVFVDMEPLTIVRKVKDYDLDLIQLHGHEDSSYIAELLVSLDSQVKVIKAISIAHRDDVEHYKTYEPLVDYFLFDTKCPGQGGSGQQFDWGVLDHYDGIKPFLLSGGIGPENARRVREFMQTHPKCLGIDLNSRFEIAPGLKDINKLSTFIQKVNAI